MNTDYRIGEWVVRPLHACIEQDDEVVHLKPKPMAVLECLRQARGEVVSRDQLFESVWPGGVVSDATLTQCIVELRRAFGDSAQTPQVIKTIPKVGFCLIPPIEEMAAETIQSEDLDHPGKHRVPIRLWTFVTALVIAVVAFGAWWYQHDVAVSVQDSIVQDTSITPSIAVLPFINMSDEPGNEYFADGLSEELQGLLAKIPQLKVSARTSSFAFRNKDVTVAEIARILNVDHLLEGSVRKTGSRIRISVQLIEANSGFELWSESYDRTLDDIFAVQDDVASAVVDALKISLMNEPPRLRETNAEVYSMYLHGRYFGNLKGKENLEKAIFNYEQALVIDPDYAPAWIGLSVAYQEQRKYGLMTEKQAFALSMAATEKALEIDSNMADAWSSLAYMKRQQLDWEGAKAAIDKAMLLEPNNTLVLGTAATLAGNLGQLETSIELFERNVELNPLSLSSLRALGLRYGYAGRYDDAIETFNRVIAINPDFPGIHAIIGMAFLLKGDPETALIEVERDPSGHTYLFHRARILTTLGNETEAQATIDKLLKTTALEFPSHMAKTYAWRGENDLAFEWFEKALQKQPGVFAYFLISPWNKGLESDPRYLALVEKIGLLEYWKNMQKPGENVPL